MANLWHPIWGVRIRDLGEKKYLFQFFHAMDMDRVLKGSLWTFNNHLLILYKLQLGEDPLQVHLVLTPFWVQIHNVPIGLFSKNLATQLDLSIRAQSQRALSMNSVWLREEGESDRGRTGEENRDFRMGQQKMALIGEEGKKRSKGEIEDLTGREEMGNIMAKNRRMKPDGKFRRRCGFVNGINVDSEGTRREMSNGDLPIFMEHHMRKIEKIHGQGGLLRDERRMEMFCEALEFFHLTDMGYSGRWFTWERGNLPETNIQERLDKGVANENWIYMFPELNFEIEKDERYWEQRVRLNWLKLGDRNIAFFHSQATQRKRKSLINKLQNNSGWETNDLYEMESIARSYFQNLFTSGNQKNYDHLLSGIDRCVSEKDNRKLTEKYTKEEVREALFEMQPTKAPSEDRFPALFYQKCWHFIGEK
ncbi:hypothetical protein Godav_024824, partial [Gossypium davidsonii]|nr:hypothetical protein [Gossypium davidsonii]